MCKCDNCSEDKEFHWELLPNKGSYIKKSPKWEEWELVNKMYL